MISGDTFQAADWQVRYLDIYEYYVHVTDYTGRKMLLFVSIYPFLPVILHCVVKKFKYLQKCTNKILPWHEYSHTVF